MAPILFPISLIGVLSALRITRFFIDRAVIPTKSVTKTGTLIISVMSSAQVLSANNLLLSVFECVLGSCATFLLLWWHERRIIDALKQRFPVFLDQWILNMRLGASLLTARNQALQQSPSDFKALLEPFLFSSSKVPTQHLVLSQNILCAIQKLQSTPYASLERLERLREYVRKSEQFRRKSGQALRQSQIQSLVLVTLHFALSIFTWWQYGWIRNSDLIISSAILAGVSLLWQRQLTKGVKWKI